MLLSQILKVFSVTFLLLPLAHGAAIVVDNPTLSTGTGSINPTNRTLVSAGNATAPATLEALTGFGVIQSWTGFEGHNLSTSDDYIFNFTDNSRADIKISLGGTVNTSAAAYLNNASFQTSAGGAFRVQAGGVGGTVNVSVRMDLGSFDSGTDTFTNGAGVQALGFTLSGRYGSAVNDEVTVTYFDSDNAILNTQIVSSLTDSYGYSGFQSAGNPISYVTFAFSGTNSVLFGLDDLGMTTAVIPESSSTALAITMLLTGLGLWLRRNIRRHAA